MNIQLNPLKFKHFKIFMDLLDSIWGDYFHRVMMSTNHRVGLFIYLISIIKTSDQIFACTVDGKVVGFCGYGMNKQSVSRFCYSLLWRLLLKLPLLKNRKWARAYYDTYDRYYTPFRADIDSELTILILDRAYHGRGIGSYMFRRICDLAKDAGACLLYIETDAECSWKTYEYCGCTKKHAIFIPGVSSCEEYIYEKQLL
jgi:GNAT superfamily N-acetyltransferase